MNAKPQILIGAAASGGGKTTVTLGLLRALRRRGMAVQPFKCGPDYIDTLHHTLAAGRGSVNLDPFMASAGHLRQLYAGYGADADVCVTEGVMGLLDGYDGPQGSSAATAALLGIPVVLVVDARSAAYSAAPLLYGYKHFCRDIRLAGVIFNRVGSESHFRHLERAARDAGVACFGYVARTPGVEIPSRHLGLTLDEGFRFEAFSDRVADLVAEHVDLERLLEACTVPFGAASVPAAAPLPARGMRIAVARDEAFNFIYRENVVRLRQLGEVFFFSPLRDGALPEGCDLLYLPGGYPEFFLERLSANGAMRRAVREYALGGGRVLAECGGMMYLCRSIVGEQGGEYPMCGVLDLRATMEGMRLRLGYRRVLCGSREFRGHEFHYSRIEGELPSVARQYDARGGEAATPLYRAGHVVAGYTHLYWGEADPLELFRAAGCDEPGCAAGERPAEGNGD